MSAMLLVAAGCCAQTVELRIVERQGQGYMPWPPQQNSFLLDNQLCFAVQGRVVGSPILGIQSVTFTIKAACEQESWGQISPLVVSSESGAYEYNQNQVVSAEVGRGGIAAQFCGLAAVDPSAEGLINRSGPGFVNNPSSQEIGMIRLAASGPSLIRALDLDGDGIPDASELNGSGVDVPQGTVGGVGAEVGATFFGASGNWVDVYRFRYDKTGYGGCPGVVTFQVVPQDEVRLFSEVVRDGAGWTARTVPAATVGGGSVSIVICGNGPPCAADQDASGTLDASDIFQYVSDWFHGCDGAGGTGCGPRSADFDCNGVVTIEDLFAFIGRWFEGC